MKLYILHCDNAITYHLDELAKDRHEVIIEKTNDQFNLKWPGI